MNIINIINNTDDQMSISPLVNDEFLTGIGVTRAIVTLGPLDLDSSVVPDQISWDSNGEFTIKFEGACPLGYHNLKLKIYYGSSVEGTYVIHPAYGHASIRIRGIS